MTPEDSGSMDAACGVQTLPRTGARHVGPPAGNRFVSSSALFSWPVRRERLSRVKLFTQHKTNTLSGAKYFNRTTLKY